MKRLATFLVSVFSLATLAFGPVLADSHAWTLNVFQPTDTITGRDVAVEYKVASIDPDHEFEITLEQDSVETNTQNISTQYGGSGAFAVTVPAAGEYEFTVTAEQLDSGETQTQTRTVTFADAPQPTTVYRTVNTGGSSASNGSGAGSSNGGVVSDAAASVTKDAGNALGAATANDTNKDAAKAANDDDNQAWLWAIPAGLLLAGGYYRFMYSQGKGPFVQK